MLSARLGGVFSGVGIPGFRRSRGDAALLGRGWGPTTTGYSAGRTCYQAPLLVCACRTRTPTSTATPSPTRGGRTARRRTGRRPTGISTPAWPDAHPAHGGRRGPGRAVFRRPAREDSAAGTDLGIPDALHPIGTIAIGYAKAGDRPSPSLKRGHRPAPTSSTAATGSGAQLAPQELARGHAWEHRHELDRARNFVAAGAGDRTPAVRPRSPSRELDRRAPIDPTRRRARRHAASSTAGCASSTASTSAG